MRPKSTRWTVLVLVALVAAPALAESVPQPVSYDGHRVVRVQIRSEADLALLRDISPDIWTESIGLGPVDARIPPAQMAALDASGLAYEVLIADLGPSARAHLEPQVVTGTWDQYMTYTQIVDFINDLETSRPDLCEIFSIGQSVEGRELWVLHITGPATGPKPAVFYQSLIHAREWISVPVNLYLADHLVTMYGIDQNVTDLVDTLDIYIMPVVNPDGYTYSWSNDRYWRKNRRYNPDGSYGVDLNRNWGYKWGGAGTSDIPSDILYRGPSPFSEPETTAISDFILAHPRIVAFMDHHSYSQLLLWPWGYSCLGGPDEPDASEYASVGNTMASLIYAVHSKYFDTGPICETIYPASGGSTDWGYGVADAFSFTFELRDTGSYGFVLPANQILPSCEENLPAMMHLTDWAAGQVEVKLSLPEGVPSLLPPGAPATIPVRIVNIGEELVANSAVLEYRYDGGTFQVAPLVQIDEFDYEAVLPAPTCGATPEFRIVAQGSMTGPVSVPATGTFSVPVGELTAFFEEDLSSNPNWSSQGQWAYGRPVGSGGEYGGPDPFGGKSGPNVYGYNLYGDYANNLSEQHLTSPAIDCTGKTGVKLSFWRWLGVESPVYDHAYVRVSNNGVTWHTVWENDNEIADTAWTYQEFDISAYADNQSTVYLRWTMGSTDGGWQYCGWNIDDIALKTVVCEAAPVCAGDANCDGFINFRDIDYFVAAQNDNIAAWEALFGGTPACTFANNDVNADGYVNFRDIDAFVALQNTTCP